MNLTEAAHLARGLMRDHGLRGWAFQYDRAKTRGGRCDHAHRVISLSEHLTRIREPENVRDTILHEIAHARVGPGHGHDATWQAMARECGARPERCFSDASIEGSYVGRCPNGHEVRRHRRPSARHSCSACSPRYDDRYALQWFRVTPDTITR